MKGIVVGIDNYSGSKSYRVILYNRSNGEWSFNKQAVTEENLMKSIIEKRVELSNIDVVNGKLIGTCGDLSRFNAEGFHPMVVIAEIISEGNVIGYKLASYDGTVSNIRIKEVYAYCNRVSGKGAPLQNAIYVPATDGKKDYIKAYPGKSFEVEEISRQKPKETAPAKATVKDNESKVSKMEELFTKEQINELMLGKKQGVDIRIFGNNKLSAEQMKEIRKGLVERVNAGLFADPSFTVSAMKAYRIQAKYGVRIKDFINPAYNAEQIIELGTGYLSGVNYAEYADPKLSANDMAKHRVYLESQLWRTVEAEEK